MKYFAVIFGVLFLFGSVHSTNGQETAVSVSNLKQIMARAPSKGLWTIKRTDTIRINLVEMSGEMKLHKHPDAEHSILVWEGRIEALIGGKTIMLTKGDFVSIPKGVPHKYTVKSKRAIIISMDAPYYDPAKTVILK